MIKKSNSGHKKNNIDDIISIHPSNDDRTSGSSKKDNGQPPTW